MRLRIAMLGGSLILTVILVVLIVRDRSDHPTPGGVDPSAPVAEGPIDGEGTPDGGTPALAPVPGGLEITVEGWSPSGGNVDRTDDGFATSGGITLEQGGLSITFAPGSEFAFVEGMPQLARGSMEVRAELETDFGRYRIPAGGSIEIGDEKVRVGAGGVLIDGTLVPGGSLIPRRRTSENPTVAERARGASGVVVDGRDGFPIAGATVRVSLCDQPEGHPLAARVPATITVTTDPDGRYTLPSISRFVAPDDPSRDPATAEEMLPEGTIESSPMNLEHAARLWLRLEVSAPGYAPVEHRTVDPRTLDGTWPFARHVLHRAWTTTVSFRLADRTVIPDATVRITEPADPYVPESGVLVQREGDAWISRRTTDARGDLPLRYFFEEWTLEHPWIVPYPSWELRPSWAGEVDDDGVDATGRPEPIFALHIIAPTIDTYELVDADGIPLPDVAIELTVPEESRTFRMRTDESGHFTIGVTDRSPGSPDLIELPKTVTLRVLDPRLRDMNRTFSIPGHPERLYLDGRPTPLVRLQLVETLSGDEIVPVAAEQVTTNADLPLLERTPQGEVVFTGNLPADGLRFEVAARDRTPTTILVPERLDRTADVDLGRIESDPGVRTTVILHGVPPEALEGATLEVSGDDEKLSTRFLTPLHGRSRVTVGGLDPLRFYRFRVTGPGLREGSGEFRLTDIDAKLGLVIPCFERELDRFETVGRVAGLVPHETRRYRVIERHDRNDRRDPAIERSIPLAPDGTFGAEHFVDGLQRSEAFILGKDALFAHAPLAPPTGDRVILHDAEGLDPPRIARVFFRAPGAGIVVPPGADFHAFDDRNHEILQVSPRFDAGRMPHVEARFLLPGGYQVRWQRPGRRDGLQVFTVNEETRTLEVVVDLLPAAIEHVALVVLGLEDAPVAGARVETRANDPEGGEPFREEAQEIAPGVYLVAVVRGRENRIAVTPTTGAVLPAEVVLPSGTAVGGPLRLVAPAIVTAEVRDPSDRPIDGVLEWTAELRDAGEGWDAGVRIRDGATARATSERGIVTIAAIPTGVQNFEVVHPSTSTSASLELDLRPGRAQLDAPIELGERRRFDGVVIEEGDFGVAGAEVLLVEPGAEHTYPLRPIDPARVLRRATTGAGGVFSFDLTGIAEGAELALVARHVDFTPAVLSPVDLAGPSATLFLRRGNLLTIGAVRTGSGDDPAIDRFRLTYLSDDPREGEIALGDVAAGLEQDFPDVRPGRYRLEWGPESTWSAQEQLRVEVTLRPGRAERLALRIDRDIIQVVGLVDGAPLADGWVVAGRDPNDLSRWGSARLIDGFASVAIPGGSFPVHAVAVPFRSGEIEDLGALDFERGTALPREIPSSELRRAPVTVRGGGPTLTFTFNDGVLADPRATLVIPRWIFEHGAWTVDGEVEIPITSSRIVLPLMRPGVIPYTVESSGPGGWSIHLSVELGDEDVVVPIIR